MSSKRDASDVILRNDYRTRYINYYVKTQTKPPVIVNIDGGSDGVNQASEVTYLKIGSTNVLDEELQQLVPPPIIVPVTQVSTLFYNGSIVPRSTVATASGIYMTDGVYLYSLPSGIILPSPVPVRSLATDSSGVLYLATFTDIYQYTSNTSSPIVSGLSNIISFAVSSNFYILQGGSSSIYMAESNASANVIAGSTPGFADGVPGKLKLPQSLTLDPTGQTLYIADTENSLIRKMTTTPPYILSTLAGNTTEFFNPFPSDNIGNRDGDGIHGDTLFVYPQGITASPTGLYIADTGNNSIRALSFTGTLTTLAGQRGTEPTYDISPQGYTDGFPEPSLWNNPTSIFFNGSSLYISEPANNAVRLINPI
jgi:hypothetical protein